MNKKNLILTLALGLMIGGCGKHNTNADKSDKDGKTSVTDTMLVVGVLNQPASRAGGPKKYLLCVDKKGNSYSICKSLNKGSTIYDENRDVVYSYIERGDTVYIQNGEIIKNLTIEHMSNRWVNDR